MLRLILVRHGQTENNLRSAYSGVTDVELNATGREQAAAAGERLKALCGDGGADGIYSSPLKRASETASIVCGALGRSPQDITVSQELCEMNFGIFENLSFDEDAGLYPREHSAYRADWLNFRIPGGESNMMVSARVGGFFRDFMVERDGGVYVFVTHMCAMAHSIASMLGLAPEAVWRFRVSNAGIVLIESNEEKFCWLSGLNI